MEKMENKSTPRIGYYLGVWTIPVSFVLRTINSSKGNAISNPQACISLGPWGGKGGVYSEYKRTDHVMQITIRHGDVIESILFESKRRDGVVIGSPVKIGGTGGGSSAKFSIDSSIEQFSTVSLTYKDYGGNVVLSSLCFDTNLKKYGPFGKGGGQSVSIPMEDGEITGFHGRGGRFVDAIGIFVAPKLKENEEELRNAYIDALIEQRTPMMQEELKTKTEELNTKTKELKEREDVFQTKMEEVEAQKKELRERIKATQKLEEELKTKIEELKTKNKELTEREEVFQTKMEEVEARKNKEPILDMETWIPIPIFSPILY